MTLLDLSQLRQVLDTATRDLFRWEQLTESRQQRQAILDTDRQFTLLHAEGALHWHSIISPNSPVTRIYGWGSFPGIGH
jgi:hypothetical protein